MKVSVRKISEETGFSPATVSNALNHKKGVSAETAKAVLEKAREMGYLETPRISKVKFLMIKRNGVVIEDTPFFTQMLRGIEQECTKMGLDLIVQNLDLRVDSFRENIEKIQNDQTCAVILLATEFIDEDMWIIEDMHVPYVVIDFWNERMTFNAVMATNQDSARAAVGYLYAKGHREIGYLKGKFRIKPFRARAAGYQQGLEKAGLTYNDSFVINLTANLSGAYEDMKAYLKDEPHLPTAFFADNDVIALGAMKAMKEAGFRIPEDVSIVGFDDISYSEISDPPLTTMRVPKEELGRQAVRRLEEVIRDNDNVRMKTQICTQFVKRSSVKDIN